MAVPIPHLVLSEPSVAVATEIGSNSLCNVFTATLNGFPVTAKVGTRDNECREHTPRWFPCPFLAPPRAPSPVPRGNVHDSHGTACCAGT